MPSSFAEDVASFAEGGCSAMEVWLTKLETHLETHSVADTRKLLDDRGVKLVAASFQGGLLQSHGDQRKAHFDHFRRRLDLCPAFGVQTMLITGDFADRVDQATVEAGVASLAEAARWAQAFGVRLALEFHGKARFCASLDTTLAVIAAAGEPNVGVCLDVFHYYTGPSKFDDLALLTPDNLFHVQVCDLAGVARELADDRDRILPGEGDFRLEPVMEQLRRVGYKGFVSLEMLNPTLWQVKPASVVEMSVKALERLLNSGSA